MAAMLALLPSMSAAANATTMGASHSINNSVTEIDYKHSENEQKEINKEISSSYLGTVQYDDSAKYINQATDRDVVGLADTENREAKAYLIDNQVLERKTAVKYNSNTGLFQATQYSEIDELYDSLCNDELGEIKDQGASATQKKRCELFEQYALSVIQSSLLSRMQRGGMISDKKLDEIKKNLKDWIKDVKQIKKDGELTQENFVTYLNKIANMIFNSYTKLSVSDNDTVLKSDALMLMYKSVWDPIRSRSILFRKAAVRNGQKRSQSTFDYWKNGSKIGINSVIPGYIDDDGAERSAKFTGDYYYYSTSNVYELYFKSLIDKGIITESDFTTDDDDPDDLFKDDGNSFSPGKEFRQSIKSLSSGTRPVWWNESSACSSSISKGLGSCIKYSSGGKFESRDPYYFKNEEITLIEILKYLEDCMKQNEDNITDAESDIIMYKYGIDYLSNYSKSDQETIKYMIAKGIIDFQDLSCLSKLYCTISYSDLYQFLYKVKNKSARTDFSKVQLTDGESYWQSQGYGESNMPIYDMPSDFMISTNASEVQLQESFDGKDSASTGNVGILSKFGKGLRDLVLPGNGEIALAATKKYTVTMNLAFADNDNNKIDWEYLGVPVKSLINKSQTSAGFDASKSQITNITYNSKIIKVYKIVFTVKATSEAMAIKRGKNYVTCPAGQDANTVTSVTKIKGEGTKTEEVMVPQSALQQMGGISVLADKVLVNTQTGSQAILFPEKKYAIVGNTIINTNSFIYQKTDSEIYYSLKVILALLTNYQVKNLGLKGKTLQLFINHGKMDEYNAKVYSEYSELNKAGCGNLKMTKSMVKYSDEMKKGDIEQYYRVNDVNNCINTMTRIYSVKNGEETKNLQLIVDWQYVIPDEENNLFDESDVKDSKSINKIVKQLYTRPSKNEALQKWWDSNYIASNSLCNFLFGTSKTTYVNSGYLVPSVTVLIPGVQKTEKQREWVRRLFEPAQDAATGASKFKLVSDKNALGLSNSASDDEFMSHVFSLVGTNETFLDQFYSDKAFSNAYDAGTMSEKQKKNLTILNTLANQSRFFVMLGGRKTARYNGMIFGEECQYYRSNAGVLFKRLNAESRMAAEFRTEKGKKSYVKGIHVMTRTKTKPVADFDNQTVIYDPEGDGTNVRMKLISKVNLGTKKKKKYYYKLVPADSIIHKDPNSDLFNEGFVYCGNDSSDKTTPVFVQNKTYEGNDLAEAEGQMTKSWKSLYQAWETKYLGATKLTSRLNDVVHWNNAFYYDNKYFDPEEDDDGDKAKIGKNTFCYRVSKDAMKKYKKSAKALSKRNVAYKFIKDISPDGSNSAEAEDAYAQGMDGNGQTTTVTDRTISELNIVRDNALSNKWNKPIGKDLKAVDHRSFVCYAIPVFYVPADSWSITRLESEYQGYSDTSNQNNDTTAFKLNNVGCVSSLSYSNFCYSSIIRSIMESIIAHDVGVQKLSTLAPKSVVTIGDIKFTVDNNYGDGNVWLTSTRMLCKGDRKTLVITAANWQSNKPKTQKAFKNEVMDVLKDIMVFCDGNAYSLTSFLKHVKKKGTASGIQVGRGETGKEVNGFGLVYSDNGKIYGYKKGKTKSQKYVKKNSGKYAYTRVKILLDGSLYVRPLNGGKTDDAGVTENSTEFTLTSTTALTSVNTTNNDFFLLDESLNEELDKYDMISISSSRYNPSAAFHFAKAKFSKLFARTMAGDLKSWLFMIIICLASYLSVMSWISYLAIHQAGISNLLMMVNSGRRGSRASGFDIIKIMTFGVYSLDDDPPLSRVIIIMMICVLIIAAALGQV